MKTTSVSSAAISNAMRYAQARMQADLVKAQKEMDSGRVADVGLALGARTTQSVTFARDLERLQGIVDSNALIASRLSSTQDALGQLTDTAEALMSALPSAISGDMSVNVTRDAGKAALKSMTSILNTSVNGEYLFAGINTDVKPINDFDAPASPARAALEAAFLARFGFTHNDPAAANITAGDMEDFLVNDVFPQFMGADWQTNWSNATDQQIVSRIALNETAETSVSANNDGVRKLAMAAAVVAVFFDSNLGSEARTTTASRAFSWVGEAVGELGQVQSRAGLIQNRLSAATERMSTQIDLFNRHIVDLEGVDPYEAANRVNDLLTHIQTSFALTARIQQLSLLNFLT